MNENYTFVLFVPLNMLYFLFINLLVNQIQHKNSQLEILIGKGMSVNYLFRFHAAS